jgi:hypothetical protein
MDLAGAGTGSVSAPGAIQPEGTNISPAPKTFRPFVGCRSVGFECIVTVHEFC